ncbi:Arginine/serine-rich coiled-coil protein 2 [Schistosoma japonicum]|nr:Arginine/serine-rich coiled-coil protein 2 [Schistosoma japonicum]KAH8854453.1 Arginine/serine-rich coiled-coil protein 2 [Schistosoma japonicum]KAH8854454.1 Arginine/serine-rich coiled-coil protein 2 [Schistosoma japonicum]
MNSAEAKHDNSHTPKSTKGSSVERTLPACYTVDIKRRSKSRERSSSRRHHKSCASRSDHRSSGKHESSSRQKRPSHHSKHKHSKRHHRDSRYDDHQHRCRRRYRRHSSTSTTSSSSDSSPESKPNRRSYNGKNSTQLLTASSKDYIDLEQKSENVNTTTVTPTTEVTGTANPPAVTSQGMDFIIRLRLGSLKFSLLLGSLTFFLVGTTINLPVQRLTAQDILDKILKHQQEQAKAQALAAAAAAKLPKYYNPTTVNAVKLAEQQQKRKLLWSKKDNENTNPESKTLWTATSLIAGKGDSAAAAKFRKLMGIHDSSEEVVEGSAHVNETEALRRAEAQAELFRRLEHEYEMSRTITHTQRGAGLGFSSSSHVDYNAYSAMQTEKDKNPNL